MIKEEIFIYKPVHKKGKIKIEFIIGDSEGCRNCIVPNDPYNKICNKICTAATRYFVTNKKLKGEYHVNIKRYMIHKPDDNNSCL